MSDYIFSKCDRCGDASDPVPCSDQDFNLGHLPQGGWTFLQGSRKKLCPKCTVQYQEFMEGRDD